MTIADAENFGVKNEEVVRVSTSGERALIFENVIIRADDKFALDMHIDIDEANAAGLWVGAWGELVK